MRITGWRLLARKEPIMATQRIEAELRDALNFCQGDPVFSQMITPATTHAPARESRGVRFLYGLLGFAIAVSEEMEKTNQARAASSCQQI
jgi:hypothetical protein